MHFGNDYIQHVRRSIDKISHVSYQTSLVKHRGGSVIVWGGYFQHLSWSICRYSCDHESKQIHEHVGESNVTIRKAEIAPLLDRIFQYDNDSKHASALETKKIKAIKRSS